mmetsp:Transcript_79295/g.224463  ORF Transcript_79295/g.224463 Transcript_79295/m.224463 type:complete len:198 (-) Transcript_79295:28-621(-)
MPPRSLTAAECGSDIPMSSRLDAPAEESALVGGDGEPGPCPRTTSPFTPFIVELLDGPNSARASRDARHAAKLTLVTLLSVSRHRLMKQAMHMQDILRHVVSFLVQRGTDASAAALRPPTPRFLRARTAGNMQRLACDLMGRPCTPGWEAVVASHGKPADDDVQSLPSIDSGRSNASTGYVSSTGSLSSLMNRISDP